LLHKNSLQILRWPEQHSHSVNAVPLEAQKVFFFLTQRPDRIWNPRSDKSNGYRRLFTRR